MMADFRIFSVGLYVSLIMVPHLLAQLQQLSTATAHSQSSGCCWNSTPSDAPWELIKKSSLAMFRLFKGIRYCVLTLPLMPGTYFAP